MNLDCLFKSNILGFSLFFIFTSLYSQSKQNETLYCAHTFKNINGTFSVTLYPSLLSDCKTPKNVKEWKQMDKNSDIRLLEEYKKYKSCKKEISKFTKKIRSNNPNKPNRDDNEIFAMRIPRISSTPVQYPIREISHFLEQIYNEDKLAKSRLMTPTEYTSWLAWKSAEKNSPCSQEIQKKSLTPAIWKNIKLTQEYERLIIIRSKGGIDKAKEDAEKLKIYPPEIPTYNVLTCSYGEGIPEITRCKTISEDN